MKSTNTKSKRGKIQAVTRGEGRGVASGQGGETIAGGARGIASCGASVASADWQAVLGVYTPSVRDTVPDWVFSNRGADWIAGQIVIMAAGRHYAATEGVEAARGESGEPESAPLVASEVYERGEPGRAGIIWRQAERTDGVRQVESEPRTGLRPTGRVTLNSRGMAMNAANFVTEKRSLFGFSGISATALADSASDAIAAGWQAWLEYSYLCGERWTVQTERYIRGEMWAAAHKSITKLGGFCGREAHTVRTESLTGEEAQTSRESIEAWRAKHGGSEPTTAPVEDRREACRFVWRALVASLPVAKGAGSASARRFAKQRAVFIIRMIHGESWERAAILSGFASGKGARESLAKGKVTAQLRLAAGKDWQAIPAIRALAQFARLAGIAAGRAVKAQRALFRLASAGGCAGNSRALQNPGRAGGVHFLPSREVATIESRRMAQNELNEARARLAQAARGLTFAGAACSPGKSVVWQARKLAARSSRAPLVEYRAAVRAVDSSVWRLATAPELNSRQSDKFAESGAAVRESGGGIVTPRAGDWIYSPEAPRWSSAADARAAAVLAARAATKRLRDARKAQAVSFESAFCGLRRKAHKGDKSPA